MSVEQIEGLTIERIEMRAFDDGRGGKAPDPRIVFTDGSTLTFSVVETESVYGVRPLYRKAGGR